MRKYPPATNLLRIVTKPYKVPDTNIKLPNGLMVLVPIYALHNDPEFYPNPEIYNPDRFTPEETQKRNPFTFMPFGEGPRVCIGLRFGMMQAKVGLATLLNNFTFELSPRTTVPLEFDPKSLVLCAKDPMYFKVKRIEE